MTCGILTTTFLDELLQADTAPTSIANGTLTPWRIDELVSVSRIFGDLLETSSSGALKRYNMAHLWEDTLILEVVQGKRLGVLD